MAFTIKKGDTSPSIQSTLKDASGTAVDIAGATVKIHMKAVGSSVLKVDQTMTIVNASGGIVKYDWTAPDTDTVGTYYVEFEVTYFDNTIETFPNNQNLTISVVRELN